MLKENKDENPEKNPYARIFGKSSKKDTKNRKSRGKKDTIGKESPGFPKL